MIKTTYPDFTFEISKISDIIIEDIICSHCNIDCADSSNFEPSLFFVERKSNISYHNVHVFSERQNLDCRICIIKKDDKYVVEVSHINISRNKLKHT